MKFVDFLKSCRRFVFAALLFSTALFAGGCKHLITKLNLEGASYTLTEVGNSGLPVIRGFDSSYAQKISFTDGTNVCWTVTKNNTPVVSNGTYTFDGSTAVLTFSDKTLRLTPSSAGDYLRGDVPVPAYSSDGSSLGDKYQTCTFAID